MPIIVDGTTIADYSAGVNVNGTAMTEVYINGTKVWTRYPYPIGTTIYTYSWSNGSNINNFITSIYASYPLAFASAPYYIQGSGNPDSRIQFTLAAGFQVSSYTQAQFGTTAPYGSIGGTFVVFVGNTVSGLNGSGNGGSSFTVKYVGN